MKEARKKTPPVAQKDCSSLSILVHPEKCTGCGTCEAACSIRRTGRKTPEGSAIRAGRITSTGGYVPLVCAVCAEAVCVNVCPGDVLSRNREFATITLRPEGCSGCSSCILSCPLGVLHMGERNSVPRPCDLCGGAPECVKSCPTGALECIDLDDKKSMARKRNSLEEIALLLKDIE